MTIHAVQLPLQLLLVRLAMPHLDARERGRPLNLHPVLPARRHESAKFARDLRPDIEDDAFEVAQFIFRHGQLEFLGTVAFGVWIGYALGPDHVLHLRETGAAAGGHGLVGQDFGPVHLPALQRRRVVCAAVVVAQTFFPHADPDRGVETLVRVGQQPLPRT